MYKQHFILILSDCKYIERVFWINIYTNHKFHKQLFQRFVFGRKPGDKSVINLILKKIRFLEGKFSLWLLHQTNQKKETKQCHKSPALRKSNRHWPVLFKLERSNAPFWDQIFFSTKYDSPEIQFYRLL